MNDYTIALALEDFLPVIFSSVGLFLIGRMIGQVNGRLGQLALAGWLLVTMGGVLKAIWKLVMALTAAQTNLVWFDKGMFLWMAVGFTLLAISVWFTPLEQHLEPKPRYAWITSILLIGVIIGAIWATGFPDLMVNTWRFILLGIMTAANIIFVILLIKLARHFRQPTAVWLFVTNIVIVFLLSGLARIPEQTIPLQWVEQLLNTFAQGAFAYAAWKVAIGRQTAVSTQLAYES